MGEVLDRVSSSLQIHSSHSVYISSLIFTCHRIGGLFEIEKQSGLKREKHSSLLLKCF